MKKLLATLGLAAMAVSVAGSALALNPQPLPPRHVPHYRTVNHHKPLPPKHHHPHHHPLPPRHGGGGHRK